MRLVENVRTHFALSHDSKMDFIQKQIIQEGGGEEGYISTGEDNVRTDWKNRTTLNFSPVSHPRYYSFQIRGKIAIKTAKFSRHRMLEHQ